MGEAPEWYMLMQQAKYLGVAPWDLMEQPVVWRTWVNQAVRAETEAKNQKKNRSTRKGIG